jgi:hypothetical protein
MTRPLSLLALAALLAGCCGYTYRSAKRCPWQEGDPPGHSLWRKAAPVAPVGWDDPASPYRQRTERCRAYAEELDESGQASPHRHYTREEVAGA